jgi:2,4-dienoyl-CoA reductase-like NADH-dependent reductase (Old Yellow Enzyme family)
MSRLRFLTIFVESRSIRLQGAVARRLRAAHHARRREHAWRAGATTKDYPGAATMTQSDLAKRDESSVGVEPLFRPIEIGRLRLPNRLVMAPMTRNRSPRGIPTNDVARYYARRAPHLAMTITEGTYLPEPTSGYGTAVPRIDDREAGAGWSVVLAAMRQAEGRIVMQLWHVGAHLQPGDKAPSDWPPISASGLVGPGQPVGRAMTLDDIERVVGAYGRAAQMAQRLGFDGIEIHAAHGYLIDTFLWREINTRMDAYGGDAAARARLAVEVVEECRRQTGPDFPILFRFSQWKLVDYDAKLVETPEELAQLVEPLADAGVDLFDCSTRRFWESGFAGSPLTLAGWTKKLSGKPVIAVGSMGLSTDLLGGLQGAKTSVATASIYKAAELIDSGEVDLIAVGRALLADPDWTEKVRTGRIHELKAFDRSATATLF